MTKREINIKFENNDVVSEILIYLGTMYKFDYEDKSLFTIKDNELFLSNHITYDFPKVKIDPTIDIFIDLVNNFKSIKFNAYSSDECYTDGSTRDFVITYDTKELVIEYSPWLYEIPLYMYDDYEEFEEEEYDITQEDFEKYKEECEEIYLDMDDKIYVDKELKYKEIFSFNEDGVLVKIK